MQKHTALRLNYKGPWRPLRAPQGPWRPQLWVNDQKKHQWVSDSRTDVRFPQWRSVLKEQCLLRPQMDSGRESDGQQNQNNTETTICCREYFIKKPLTVLTLWRFFNPEWKNSIYSFLQDSRENKELMMNVSYVFMEEEDLGRHGRYSSHRSHFDF